MAEALETASNYPEMTVIPGIELSTEVPGSEIHVLGYYVDCGEPSFQRMLAEFREGRVDRGRQMVRKLNDLGLRISWERVLELSGGGAVGRPHMAQALVEAGYVRYPPRGLRTVHRPRRPRLHGAGEAGSRGGREAAD